MAFFGQLFKSAGDASAADSGPSSIRRSSTEGAAHLSDAASRVRSASVVEMAEYDEEELLKLSPAELVEKLQSAEQGRDAAVANMMDSVSAQEQDRQHIIQLQTEKEEAEKQLKAWKLHASQVANVVQAVRDTFDELAKAAAQPTTPTGSADKTSGSSPEQPAAFMGSKGTVTTVNRLTGPATGKGQPVSAPSVDTSDPGCLGDVCAALIEVKIHLAEMAFKKESATAGLSRRMQAALTEVAAAHAAEAAARAATDDVTTQLLNLKMQNTNLHEQLAAAEIENRALEETATKARVELLRAKRKSVAVASKYGTWGAGVASGPRSASGSSSGSPLNKTSALGLTMDEYTALHGGGMEGGSPEPLGSISDTEGGDDDDEGGPRRSSRGHSGGDDSVLSAASSVRNTSDDKRSAGGNAQRSVRFGSSAFEGGSADAEGGGHGTAIRKSLSTPMERSPDADSSIPSSPRGSLIRSHSLRLSRNKRHSAQPTSGGSLPVPLVTEHEGEGHAEEEVLVPTSGVTPPAELPSSLRVGGGRSKVSHLSLKRASRGRGGRGRGRGAHKNSYSTLPKGFNVNDFLASAAAAEGEGGAGGSLLAEGGDDASVHGLSPAKPPAAPAAGSAVPSPTGPSTPSGGGVVRRAVASPGGGVHEEHAALVQAIARIPLFSSLQRKEQAILAARMESMRFGNQDVVFNGLDGGGGAWKRLLASHSHAPPPVLLGEGADDEDLSMAEAIAADMAEALFIIVAGTVTVFDAITSASGPFDLTPPTTPPSQAAETSTTASGGQTVRPGVSRFGPGSCFTGADVGRGCAVAKGGVTCMVLRPGVLSQVMQWFANARHVAEITALLDDTRGADAATLRQAVDELVSEVREADTSGRAYLAVLRRHSGSVSDLPLPSVVGDLYGKCPDSARLLSGQSDLEAGEIVPASPLGVPLKTHPVVENWPFLCSEVSAAVSQAMRDLQRETAVYVNGARVDVGSPDALPVLVATLTRGVLASCRSLLDAVTSSSDCSAFDAVHCIVRDVLMASSRTHSGGDSYAQCDTLFGSPGRVMLTPEPGAQQPITVTLADDTIEVQTVNMYRISNLGLEGVVRGGARGTAAQRRARVATSPDAASLDITQAGSSSRASFDESAVSQYASSGGLPMGAHAHGGAAGGGTDSDEDDDDCLLLAVLRSEVTDTLTYTADVDSDAVIAELGPSERAAKLESFRDAHRTHTAVPGKAKGMAGLLARLGTALRGQDGTIGRRRSLAARGGGGDSAPPTPPPEPDLLSPGGSALPDCCPAVLNVKTQRSLSVVCHVLAQAV